MAPPGACQSGAPSNLRLAQLRKSAAAVGVAPGFDLNNSSVAEITDFVIPWLASSIRLSTILVVDDDPMHRLLVRVILENEGHAIVEAANGEEALDIIGPSAVPDIVITDLEMPLLTGEGLIQRLQWEPRTATIPIVVVSIDHDAALALKDSGLVDAVVTKPIGVSALANAIRTVANTP